MRKALIAVIAAAVLFAVGAFAANLTISSDGVASGEATVAACGAARVIDYDVVSGGVTPTNSEDTDWKVNGATVELDGECVGAEVEIAIRTLIGGSSTWINGSAPCSTTTGEFPTYSCSFAPTDVNPIVEVAVLVNGDTIEATAP